MCHFGRAWELAPDGMLRRNGLIAAPDVERLEAWLDGADDRTAFEEMPDAHA